MAWEELLLLHDEKPEDQLLLSDGKAKEKGSLIRQVRALVGQTGGENAAAAEPDEPEAPRPCPDGYVRRSPVQPYRTAEDYFRRRTRKAVLAVIVLVLAVLLVLALMKTGLLQFRLR